ncbi:unnamed protein product, partial [marine sediment metagenome]
LRATLSTLRKTSPENRQLIQLAAEKERLAGLLKQGETIQTDLLNHGAELTEESSRGEMDVGELTTVIARNEALLKDNDRKRQELDEEQDFLGRAYDYLLQHQDLKECPLCATSVDMPELIKRTKERTEGRIARELERIQQRNCTAAKEKEGAEQRLATLKTLRESHSERIRETRNLIENLQGAGADLSRKLDADGLFADEKKREELDKALQASVEKLRELTAAAQGTYDGKVEEKKLTEEQEYQPAESRVNKV